MSSLKNHILISMPYMQDPYFGKTVILICEHTKDGAMGLIINRSFQEPDMEDLFSEIYKETENIFKVVPTIYFGGPVMIERGIVLHSSEYKRKGTYVDMSSPKRYRIIDCPCSCHFIIDFHPALSKV